MPKYTRFSTGQRAELLPGGLPEKLHSQLPLAVETASARMPSAGRENRFSCIDSLSRRATPRRKVLPAWRSSQLELAQR